MNKPIILTDNSRQFNEIDYLTPRYENANFGYHTQPHQNKVRLRNNDVFFKVGFEVEKEDRILHRVWCHKVFTETKWRKERDGSLNSDGFELVSPTFNLTNPETLKNDVSAPVISALLNANYSENCGNHFHVSHTHYNADFILKGVQNYLPLLYAMYGKRKSNSFCKAKTLSELLRYPEKYSAAFLTNYGTLEFRIFPALANVKQLQFRLTLLSAILDNLGDSGKAVIENCVNPKSPLFRILNTVYKDANRFESLIGRISSNLHYSQNNLNEGFDMSLMLKVYKPKYNKYLTGLPTNNDGEE